MKQLVSETDSVPEQQRSSPWRRVRRWLGFVSSTSQREGDSSVSNGNDSARRHARTIASEVPDFLDLGPQRYGDPSFLVPDVDGPLLENKDYQRALRAVGQMKLPSETLSKRSR